MLAGLAKKAAIELRKATDPDRIWPDGLEFNAPQRDVLKCFTSHTTIVLAWGRGVGKTFMVRQLMWKLVAQYDGVRRKPGRHKGVRIIVLMPTLKQFWDVYGADILADLIGPDAPWGWLGGHVNLSTKEIQFPGGSWIKPFPAAEHVSHSALGMRCDAIFLDEQDSIYSGVLDGVAMPWLSATWSLGIIFGVGTPRRGRYGLHYRQFKFGRYGDRIRAGDVPDNLTAEEADEYSRCFAFSATYANVPETVPAAIVTRARVTIPKAIFQREWEHNFDAAEGLVYGDVWDESFHVRIPPETVVWNTMLVGGDKGYEDPGVFLLVGIIGHGNDAVLWVLDEIYEQHKVAEWWCRKLALWVQEEGVRKVYYDPSAADWKATFRSSCGVSTPDVDNAILDGVDAVANLFLRRTDPEHKASNDPNAPIPEVARLYIHPRCRNLIRELSSYRRKADPRDPDVYTDDIVDKNNHAPDALRYVVSGHIGLKKAIAA